MRKEYFLAGLLVGIATYASTMLLVFPENASRVFDLVMLLLCGAGATIWYAFYERICKE